jgi:hypothetical protein
MPYVTWNALGQLTRKNATIAEPWIIALEELRRSTYVRIQATGSWVAVHGLVRECGPNGLSEPIVPQILPIVNDCPFGALIAKFGGNAASLAAASTNPPSGTIAPTEGQPFGVGSYCVAKTPADFVGPLFIGFNSQIRPVWIDELEVIISGTVVS